MCEAEDDLRRAEQTIGLLEDRMEQLVELAADVDRGIITTGEFRKLASDLERKAMARV